MRFNSNAEAGLNWIDWLVLPAILRCFDPKVSSCKYRFPSLAVNTEYVQSTTVCTELLSYVMRSNFFTKAI